MSQTAARPWWADVQHLRPDEGGGENEERLRGEDRARRSGRFERRPAHARRERREPEVWLDPSAPASVLDRPAARSVELVLEQPVTEERPAPRERRTIQIRGQVDRIHGVAPISSPGPQRHRGVRPSERVGPRPDRVALWAVLLGLLLILVAAISSPGADAAAIVAGAGL